MSRREDRDSHRSERLHSRRDREPSPKKPRREDKAATERTHRRNHDPESVDPRDRDQKQHKQLQDALLVHNPPIPESKERPDIAKDGQERKHDERGGRSFGRGATDHGRWSDKKEQPSDRSREKRETHDMQRKTERTQSRTDANSVWRHDGFYELEADAPPAKKRPAFREQKIPVEPESAAVETGSEAMKLTGHDQPPVGTARKEDKGNYSRGLDRPVRPSNRDEDRYYRRGEGSHGRAEVAAKNSYHSRERYGGGSTRGRERFDGRYGGDRNTPRPGGFQVEKWKHDLYDEANRSPTPKNEEDQIAKVEALLSS